MTYYYYENLYIKGKNPALTLLFRWKLHLGITEPYFLTQEFQLINIGGMMELIEHHFSVPVK